MFLLSQPDSNRKSRRKVWGNLAVRKKSLQSRKVTVEQKKNAIECDGYLQLGATNACASALSYAAIDFTAPQSVPEMGCLAAIDCLVRAGDPKLTLKWRLVWKFWLRSYSKHMRILGLAHQENEHESS